MIRQTLTAAACLAATAGVQAQQPQGFTPESMEGFAAEFRMSPAIRAGDFVFISGVVGYIRNGEDRTPEAYEAAIRDAFERVDLVLNEAGTGWDEVVEMTTFHVDMREHQEIFRQVREEFISEPYPAWTGIGVETLWSDALFVEIRVQAYVGDD